MKTAGNTVSEIDPFCPAIGDSGFKQWIAGTTQ
jgi:hypothetical protein